VTPGRAADLSTSEHRNRDIGAAGADTRALLADQDAGWFGTRCGASC